MTKESLSSMNMVLSNHIYELQKGVRNLVLYTVRKELMPSAIRKLENQGIEYLVQTAGDSNVNIFFGRPACIKTVKHIVKQPLYCLTPEQDFILGALLGYDICLECERFIERAGA